MQTIEQSREGSFGKTPRTAAGTFLFRVLECNRPLASSARHSLDGIVEVAIHRGAEAQVTLDGGERGRRLELALPDPWMSAAHAVLTRGLGGRWQVRDESSRNGTMVNGRRVAESPLADGDVLEVGRTLFIFRDGLGAAGDLDSADLGERPPGVTTLLPHLEELYAKVEQIAATQVPVVLFGESGTGKEMLARAVHTLSRRRGAFVAVNCGALPDSLIESELFGHRKGAFSGATEDRPGLVRSADGGTLFLDEIGDLPSPAQAAFLRVLQEREVVPIGGTRPIPVDVRLVSASLHDVEAMSGDKRFRPDLWARISGFKVTLPPLRERIEDLGWLLALLLRRVAGARADKVTFHIKAGRALLTHAWPLNVRELEKALAAGVALAGDSPVGLEHLPPNLGDASSTQPPLHVTPPPSLTPPPLDEINDTLPFSSEDIELRAELMRLLEEHKGNIAAVGRAMGKARMQIQRWLKRFLIDPESYRR